MAAASLIGFGLVFLFISALSSLLLGAWLVLAGTRLRAKGPWVERLAATIALAAPPLVGLTVTATLAGSKLLAVATGTDHCLDHPHHLHLCLDHGTQWASVPWAVVAIGFFATFVLARFGQTTWAHLAAQLTANRIKQSSDPVTGFEHTFLVPSDEKFAFTTGVFSPTVIVSRAAWQALDASGGAALLAHEQAHVAHGDLWKRAVLGLLACFGVPVLARRALKLWEHASERICDRVAARRVGKSSIVASAILSLAQFPARSHAPTAAVFAAGCHVSDRIVSLSARGPGGKPAAMRLALVVLATCFAAATVCLLFAESLHHILETILG